VSPRFVYASLYYKIGLREEYESLLVGALRSLKVEVLSSETPQLSGWESQTEAGGIAWVSGFDKALEEARRRRVPAFVAIGSQREAVCLELARAHYREPAIVSLSRQMVCLVASVDNHGLDDQETCKLYGSVNCAEHRDVEIRCRERFIKKSVAIAPQHLIISPEGHVLSRREYFLSKSDLRRMMQGAIAALASQGDLAGREGEAPVDHAARYAAATRDEERQVVLNAAFHFSGVDTVKDLLDSIARTQGREGVLRIMRFLDLADHPGKLEILTFYLESPDEFIRRQAANLLARQTRSGPSDLRIIAIIGLAGFPTGTKDLDSTLVKAYSGNKGNFGVKSVAALALGRHRVSGFGAVKMMQACTEKITDRMAVDDIDSAIRSIQGHVSDPELDFLERVGRYMLDVE